MATQAFTLIELLVVMVIISILSAIAMAGVASARKSADKAKETAAAKTLISAYTLATNDRDGTLLPAYDQASADVTLPDGTIISYVEAWRYPYRLAPYFGYRMEGTILVGENARQISIGDTYQVSLYPAFGINYNFVGGAFGSSGTQADAQECVNRPAQSASIIVFATAAYDTTHGFCNLTPPRTYTTNWSNKTWAEGSSPALYGQVDARYGGKAICAFLDGSVRTLSVEELRDMRLWNKNAAATDNKDYVITSSSTPRPGR